MILIKKHRTEREEVEKILREKLHYIDYIESARNKKWKLEAYNQHI